MLSLFLATVSKMCKIYIKILTNILPAWFLICKVDLHQFLRTVGGLWSILYITVFIYFFHILVLWKFSRRLKKIYFHEILIHKYTEKEREWMNAYELHDILKLCFQMPLSEFKLWLNSCSCINTGSFYHQRKIYEMRHNLLRSLQGLSSSGKWMLIFSDLTWVS